MHTLRSIIIFCIILIAQSSECSNKKVPSEFTGFKGRLASDLGVYLKNAFGNKTIQEINETFLASKIAQFFSQNPIKDMFKLKDACDNHKYFVFTCSGLVSLSCAYTAFRVIKCTRKYFKKKALWINSN